MALADYRLCDVCDCKAFYDAELGYWWGQAEAGSTPPYRQAGAEQMENPEHREKHGMRLGYLGDWAVICSDCSPRFKTAIVPVEEAPAIPSPGAHTNTR